MPLVPDWSQDGAPSVTNPIRPCGACAEWLTKLHEANPGGQCTTDMHMHMHVHMYVHMHMYMHMHMHMHMHTGLNWE